MPPATMKTLMKPPPEDPARSPIENVVEVTELAVLGPDIFTNTRPPWHPPGARGVYGGSVVAMSLAAGQRTVPPAFFPHSCHCYFLLAGAGDLPILFHVERVRDGRSFATRTVQARQKGRAIFTATVSFVKEGSSGGPDECVAHAAPMPTQAGGAGARLAPPAAGDGEPEFEGAPSGPFESRGIEVLHADGAGAHAKKTRQWVRARGRISAGGGTQAHLNALAYISDSYFIGTISRVHRLWRFPFPAAAFESLPEDVRRHVRRLNDWEGGGADVAADFWRGRPQIGMMVSLDHTIYFHAPRRVRADEWMLSEMESPWAGDGRGLVTQRIFAADGTLLATCVQEGLVRLKAQDSGGGGEDAKAKL